MFGVPFEGPANIFCNNQSVVTSSTIPASMLNKNHNVIWYHKGREGQATGTIRVAWISGEYIKADLLTKTTLNTGRRYDLVSTIFTMQCEVLGRWWRG